MTISASRSGQSNTISTLRALSRTIDTSGHTELERQVMQEHRWFEQAEISAWNETIYPQELVDLVARFV